MKLKMEKIVNHINETLIDLRNAFNKKKILEDENPDKVIDIVEEILNFNKQQKAKVIKLLTHKQRLLRLSIPLA